MKQVAQKTHAGKNLRTICEVHRDMYDMLYELTDDRSEELKELIEEAYILAKKMDAKLRQYKNNYDDDWWKKERAEAMTKKIELRKLRGAT